MKYIQKPYLFPILSFLIVLLAFLLRFPYLSTFPPSMVQDEVGLGYSAISIAETGKDEWGYSFPLVFKSFGDYKPPAFIYLTALLYKVIGWNFALPRITSAIAGVIIVICSIIWIRNQTKSNELGLLAGLITAVSPWTIHLSRMALESNVGLAFFFLGLVFLSTTKKLRISILLSSVFFSLSSYSYHGYRYTVLLFLSFTILFLFILHYKKLQVFWKYSQKYFIILVLSTALSLPGFLSGGVTNRLDQTLLLTSEKAAQVYDHNKNNCFLTFATIHPALAHLCRIKYNSFTRPIIIFGENYIQHLTPGFLFFTGDDDPGRNPTATGELYVVLLPFWMAGMLGIFQKFQRNSIILSGYFVSLIPSALSGTPHAIRLTVLIPFVLFCIIEGYVIIKSFFSKFKYFTHIFIFLLLTATAYFVMDYTVDTYASHEGTFTYLSFAKKAAQITYEYSQKGYIVYSDLDMYPEPHIYYAYWNKISPEVTQHAMRKIYTESAGFERPQQFGDTVFFEGGKIHTLACNTDYSKPTLFITNDPVALPVHKIIKDNTLSYNIIFVYELDEIRKNKEELLSFCNQ